MFHLPVRNVANKFMIKKTFDGGINSHHNNKYILNSSKTEKKSKKKITIALNFQYKLGIKKIQINCKTKIKKNKTKQQKNPLGFV